MKKRKLKFPIQQVVTIVQELRSGANLYTLAGRYKVSPSTIQNWNQREDINAIIDPRPTLPSQSQFDKILKRLSDLESKLELTVSVKRYNKVLTNGHFK